MYKVLTEKKKPTHCKGLRGFIHRNNNPAHIWAEMQSYCHCSFSITDQPEFKSWTQIFCILIIPNISAETCACLAWSSFPVFPTARIMFFSLPARLHTWLRCQAVSHRMESSNKMARKVLAQGSSVTNVTMAAGSSLKSSRKQINTLNTCGDVSSAIEQSLTLEAEEED